MGYSGSAGRPGYADGADGGPRDTQDRLVYLDHAATTQMLPEAIAALTEELAHLGNPSSLHNAGRRARRVVEESREQIADAFGARPSEVIFTSGGTESDNLAVKGLYWARRAAGLRRRRVLVTSVEHHAVLDSAEWLAGHEGAEICWLGVDSTGLLSPETLREEIGADPGSVALISAMWANNEVGTIQPVAELAAVAREYQIPFHTDAVQAAGQVAVHFAAAGVDALTITGHKIGGPVGGRAAACQGSPAGAGDARRGPGERHQVGHARRARGPGVRDRGPDRGQTPGRGGRPARRPP